MILVFDIFASIHTDNESMADDWRLTVSTIITLFLYHATNEWLIIKMVHTEKKY